MNIDSMEKLLNNSQFTVLPKSKHESKHESKTKEININNDSQEEIIKKLIITIDNLKNELKEYKNYVEGTYCTISVFNREIDNIDKRIDDIQSSLE